MTGRHSYVDSVADFIFLSDEPQKADAIFVPGSRDRSMVLRAVQLWQERFAPVIIISGNHPKGKDAFEGPADTEADYLAGIAMAMGVPEPALLLEREATYTWENAQFSRRLCDLRSKRIRKAILCCKPWHARRALLYYQAAFPDTEWLVCPGSEPQCSRENWYQTETGRKRVLGEIQRLGSQVSEVFEEMIRHA